MTNGRFETTHWSVVLAAARDETRSNRDALDRLCQIYYEPVRAFIRTWLTGDASGKHYGGLTEQDLTQEFFAEFLTRGVGNPTPEKGRFRSYLLGRVRHFLSHVREKSSAVKRGGGEGTLPLDTGLIETLSGDAPFPPDAWFDRQWARSTVAAALDAVKRESDFPPELIQRMFGPVDAALRQRLSDECGLSDLGVKVALCRLRKAFRTALRQIVAETLDDPNDSAALNREIAYLTDALGETSQ